MQRVREGEGGRERDGGMEGAGGGGGKAEGGSSQRYSETCLTLFGLNKQMAALEMHQTGLGLALDVLILLSFCLDVESYAAIKKPKQKKKRKGSHSDQPLLSPPHTPPPLPPSLEELSREGKVSSNKGDNAGTPRHQLQDEADDDLGVTCLRCKKSLASGKKSATCNAI